MPTNFENLSLIMYPQEPLYLLTRDEFTLVAMGFTSQKSLDWKVAYIRAFSVTLSRYAYSMIVPGSRLPSRILMTICQSQVGSVTLKENAVAATAVHQYQPSASTAGESTYCCNAVRRHCPFPRL